MKKSTLLTLLALLLLAGSGLLYALLDSLSVSAEEEVLASMQETLAQTGQNIADRMDAVSAITLMLGYDYRMQTAIKRNPGEETAANQLLDIAALREMIDPVLARVDVSHVRIFLSEDKLLSRERVNFFPISQVTLLPEYAEIRTDVRGEGVWIGRHSVALGRESLDVLTHARFIRTLYDYERIGAYILVDMPAQRLLSVMEDMSLPEGGELFLMDAQGQVQLSLNPQGVPEAVAASAAAMEAPCVLSTVEGERAALLRVPLPGMDWSLVSYVPRNLLLAGHRLLQRVLIILVPLLVLLLIVCVLFAAYSLYTRGVRQYLRRLTQILSEKGVARYRSSGLPDVYRLGESVDTLIDTLDQLTQDAYQARLREREAVLRALQAQINPHFLYNTLDMIHWMALRHGARDVSHMLETLAHYFRLSLSGGQDIVTVRVDVDMVQSYLKLQAARFEGAFEAAYDLQPEAMECLLPKLTLQPLVENALLHGIRKRRDKTGGRIALAVRREEGRLWVRIRDNGPGVTEASEPETPELAGGFGLQNVRERLMLLTGGDMTMTLENHPEGGAEVTLSLPASIVQHP